MRTLNAFPDRSFEVRVPWASDGGAPVLLILHGGGGNRATALEMSCLTDGGSCLQDLALDAGYVVVIPDGTPSGPGPVASRLRTWNGGGGDGGWQCVSGIGCSSGVNEAAFFALLLADLRNVTPIQDTRVFATGFSNGAALSHRLACELPAIRAIASVAGGNQFSTNAACPRRAAIMEFHGTADPCWNYDGGAESCGDPNPGVKIGVEDTMRAWAARNGCLSTALTQQVADAGPFDPTSVSAIRWPGCANGNDVVLMQVVNGGHTWPRGAEPRISTSGRVSQAISANEVMLEFFKAH